MKILLTICLLCCLLEGWVYSQEQRTYKQHVQLQPGDTNEQIIRKAANVVPSRSQMLYHRDEFTGFIHFGPNTFSGVEWGNGKENPSIFNPGETLDTDQWCRILKAAEIKKVIITVKHHDGFCTWQTRYNDKFSVRAIPWREGQGDVLRELAQSCKKHGLKLGVYLSPADLYQIESAAGLYGNGSRYQSTVIPTAVISFKSDPTQIRADKPADAPSFAVEADDYNRYFMNQLYELLTEYGPIHEVWFDGAHPKRKGDQTYIKQEWFKMIRRLAPDAAIFGGPDIRWCGNEAGRTRQSEWNIIPVESNAVSGVDRPADDIGSDKMLLMPSYEIYGKTYQSNFLYYMIAEVDTSIRHGWFWRNDDEQTVRTPGDVFDIYERTVGGNAGFLLNVPPNIRGLISPRDEACLIEVGKRIRADLFPKPGGWCNDGFRFFVTNSNRRKSDQILATGRKNGSLVVLLPASQKINRFVLQEAISQVGQRVKSHELDAWVDGNWKKIVGGTTIGYKKILRFPDITTDRFRIRILESRLKPTIAEIAAHYYVAPPAPSAKDD